MSHKDFSGFSRSQELRFHSVFRKYARNGSLNTEELTQVMVSLNFCNKVLTLKAKLDMPVSNDLLATVSSTYKDKDESGIEFESFLRFLRDLGNESITGIISCRETLDKGVLASLVSRTLAPNAFIGNLVNFTYLKRKISVRLMNLSGMNPFASVICRGKLGIEYSSLDCFIGFCLSGQTINSAVISGQLSPFLWNQILTFDLTMPDGDPNYVQSWVQSQYMEFSVNIVGGAHERRHTERLAVGHVSLSRIIGGFTDSQVFSVELLPLHYAQANFNAFTLNVEVVDASHLKNPWAHVLDYTIPLETSLKLHNPKIIASTQFLEQQASLDKGGSFWDRFNTFNRKFASRTVPVIAVTKQNVICVIPALFSQKSTLSAKMNLESIRRLMTWNISVSIKSDDDMHTLKKPLKTQFFCRSSQDILASGRATNLEKCVLFYDLLRSFGDEAILLYGESITNNCFMVVTKAALIKTSQVIGTETFKKLWPHFNCDIKKSTSAIYWDMDSVMPWTLDMGGFPMRRIWSAYSNSNIYCNIQSSDFIQNLSLEFKNEQLWTSLLNGSVVPVNYSDPSRDLLTVNPLIQKQAAPTMSVYDLVQDLAVVIIGYRRHFLYIAGTQFHRSISGMLQAEMTKGCTDSVILGNLATRSLEDGCMWSGRIFKFFARSIDEVIDALVSTGVLDCGTPRTLYAYACRIDPGSSLEEPPLLTIYIGFMQDLNTDMVLDE